jgi:hypothetical protein
MGTCAELTCQEPLCNTFWNRFLAQQDTDFSINIASMLRAGHAHNTSKRNPATAVSNATNREINMSEHLVWVEVQGDVAEEARGLLPA